MIDMAINNDDMRAGKYLSIKYGIGFTTLMELADAGRLSRVALPPDHNGQVAYLFSESGVSRYVQEAAIHG